MIESRRRFLERFLRLGAAGVVVLVSISTVGCGGFEGTPMEDEDEEEEQEED